MADDILRFQTPPFAAEGSGKFLYLDAPRRRILADLIAHVCDGEGPILLVAEPGMGKTMLLDRLAEEANAHNIRVVFSLVNVRAIADATETDPQPPAFLLDDGNALPLGVWHQLISLMRSTVPSVPETAPKRLPPIVIALTPDLLDWLFAAQLVPRSTPLDRIFRLPAFASRDVGRFIALRMRVAGVDRPEIFTAEAIDRIAVVTEGVPARINRVCEAALAEAARRGRTDVTVDIVEAAAALVELESPPTPIASTLPPQPILQPEPSAGPPPAVLGLESAPSIGIVGAGYAPVRDAKVVRHRMRRHKIPLWSGVAIAAGVAAVASVALLGYVAGPNVSRPSVTHPAATSSDATAAALDARPMLPSPPAESNFDSVPPFPTPGRLDPPELRSSDVHRDVRPGAAEEAGPSGANQKPASPPASELATLPPAAPIAPVQDVPMPAAPVQAPLVKAAPVQAAPQPPALPPAREAAAARPAPASKVARPGPAADRPQPRIGQPARGDAVSARRQERVEEPPAVGGDPAPGEDTLGLTEEGRQRPVKELIEMGDEFRDAGDTEWARRLYRAAQERGSAKAAVAEGETYDPQYAAASSRADADEARRLYSDAARQGDREAAKRLEELDQWMSERSTR